MYIAKTKIFVYTTYYYYLLKMFVILQSNYHLIGTNRESLFQNSKNNLNIKMYSAVIYGYPLLVIIIYVLHVLHQYIN